MKKTLITLLFVIVMSAGIFFSADSVSAYALPVGYTVDNTEYGHEFTTDYDNLEYAVIEYSYYQSDVLMSRLIKVDLNLTDSNSALGTYTYGFTLPEEALSFIIWRVITESEQIKSLTGSFEYVESPETAISEVQVRIKIIYIEDDLITRESTLTDLGSFLQTEYVFKMHFNLEDVDGQSIPVDRITSLTVTYNVVSTTWSWVGKITTTDPVTKDIQATTTTPLQVWPYFYPASVVNNIEESISDDYDWMVRLGSYDYMWPAKDVTIDQTSILTISYLYDGVFYDSLEVQDEPYEEEDVVDVAPGTVDPLVPLMDTVIEWLEQFDTALRWVIMIVFAILAMAIIFLVVWVLKMVIAIPKAIITIGKFFLAVFKYIYLAIYYLVKYVIKTLVFIRKLFYQIVRFILKILISIPGWIMSMILFLVLPSEKRKYRKESASNVSRYI